MLFIVVLCDVMFGLFDVYRVVVEVGDLLVFCDYVIFELFYGFGIWVFEFCGLDVDDLDFDCGMVCVFGKGLKECVVLYGMLVWDVFDVYFCWGCFVFVVWVWMFILVVIFGSCGGWIGLCMVYDLVVWVFVLIVGVEIIGLYVLCYIVVMYFFDGGVDFCVV